MGFQEQNYGSSSNETGQMEHAVFYQQNHLNQYEFHTDPWDILQYQASLPDMQISMMQEQTWIPENGAVAAGQAVLV